VCVCGAFRAQKPDVLQHSGSYQSHCLLMKARIQCDLQQCLFKPQVRGLASAGGKFLSLRESFTSKLLGPGESKDKK
jgi:hypothetical protein